MVSLVIERLRRWPRPRTHEEKVEQAIDRLMLVELWLYWYIAELEDLKTQLSEDPLLRQLVSILNVMIQQLKDLIRRWATKKYEIIKAVRKGLARKERKIEGDGFWVQVTYNKYIIDLIIRLNGGSGDYAKVPDLGIPETVLRAMRIGWRASDSTDNNDRYPAMTTAFVWQVIAWLVAYPNTEAWIYAQEISVSKDDIKPVWSLKVNDISIEWPDDITAYREMVRLPRDLLAIAILHAILGDGNGNAGNNNSRYIKLLNDEHEVLKLTAKKLNDEFNINRPTNPHNNVWRYEVSGESAKTLAELIINTLEELAPVVKRLYDLMADGSRYTLIHFEKWAIINRASEYIYNESKVLFAGIAWTPHFSNGGVELMIETKDVKLAEELKDKVKSQGIDVIVTKRTRKSRNTTYYEIKIRWSELKRHLCDERLRKQLIKVAERAIENCRLRRMLGKSKKDCSQINAVQWLRKLQDIEWLKKRLRCQNPCPEGP